MSVFAKAAMGVKWTALSQVFSASFSFIVFAVLSRQLLPHDLGVFALVLVVLSLCLTGFNGVFCEPLVQRTALTDEDTSTFFWTSIGFGMTVALASLVLAPVAADFFAEPAMVPLLRVLAIKIMADAAASVPTALRLRRFDFGSLGRQTMMINFASGSLAVGVALLGFGIWALAAQQLMISLVTLACNGRACGWQPQAKWQFAALKRFARFSGSVYVWQVLNFLNSQFDRGVIGSVLGAATLGLYASGRRINEMLIETTAGAIAFVALPIFSSLQDQPEQVRNGYLKTVSLLVFFSFPASLGLAVVAPRLVPLLFGPHWVETGPIVQIFAITGIIRAIGTIQSIALRSMGKPTWWLGYLLIQNAVNIVVLLTMVHFGILWTAIAIVIREYALWPISFIMVQRLLKISLTDYLRTFLPPLGAALTMVCAILLCNRLLPVTWPDAAVLLLNVVLGAVVYVGASFVMNREGTFNTLNLAVRVVRAKAA